MGYCAAVGAGFMHDLQLVVRILIEYNQIWSEHECCVLRLMQRAPGNRPPPHEAPVFNPQAQPFRPSGGPRQQGPNRRPPHQAPYQGPQQTPHQAPYQAPRRPPAPATQPVVGAMLMT